MGCRTNGLSEPVDCRITGKVTDVYLCYSLDLNLSKMLDGLHLWLSFISNSTGYIIIDVIPKLGIVDGHHIINI